MPKLKDELAQTGETIDWSFPRNSALSFNEWRKLVSDYKIVGVQVHDAKLVASMIAHNIQSLITFNEKDFKRFPMITVLNPKDI